jgi:hypothetical protein
VGHGRGVLDRACTVESQQHLHPSQSPGLFFRLLALSIIAWALISLWHPSDTLSRYQLSPGQDLLESVGDIGTGERATSDSSGFLYAWPGIIMLRRG